MKGKFGGDQIRCVGTSLGYGVTIYRETALGQEVGYGNNDNMTLSGTPRGVSGWNDEGLG